MRYEISRCVDGTLCIDTSKKGNALLTDALLNKGTAFTAEERTLFGLDGLLPSQVTSKEEQLQRAYEHITRKGDNPLEKYIGMASLQDRNETLFYQLLAAHPDELIPIVYTPTVGEAATRFSHIFRRGRGIWITPGDKGRIYELLGNVRNSEVKLIVATDNERILGLGDQGAGGMVIPIGKLALYTMAAGIHPAHTLPVSLDVGTDNEELLDDPLYAGWRHPRLRGDPYTELVDEFVAAVRRRFPRAVVQWEDFKKANAFRVLDRYRETLPSFNDDIQGTAAVVAAGLLTASDIAGTKITAQRILLVGAGAAGIGIATQLRHILAAQGLGGDALIEAIAVMDSRGLVTAARDDLDEHKVPFAWSEAMCGAHGIGPDSSLLAVVEAYGPTVLIGTTGHAGTFTEAVLGTLAGMVERPVVMPLSNPNTKCEATPAAIATATGGRAIVATGSPFEPVTYGGSEFPVAQGNNVLAFPGIGLGAIVSEARVITDAMFAAAAGSIASDVTEQERADGIVYPPLRRLRRLTRQVAHDVVVAARKDGVGKAFRDDEIAFAIDERQWDLSYPMLRPV